jgi:hypothetical protein
MLDVGELDEPRAIWIIRRECGGDVDGEPRLPDSSGPAQRKRTRGGSDPANLAYFTVAANKGIKLLTGITVNAQFHIVARLWSGQLLFALMLGSNGNVPGR